MTKGTFLFYGHLKVLMCMKLWPPCSEIMEFLISSYHIVQLTSVKFCTLIKDNIGTVQVQLWPSWCINEGFQLPNDCSMISVQLDTLIKLKEDF